MDSIIRKYKSQPQKRRYFTKATEAAIVQYNKSTDEEERSDLYAEFIHWPFYKLTENIIHTFKFYHTDGVDNLEDLQHELMVFLLSKIDRKSTRLNSSHGYISYAVFCLKKKKERKKQQKKKKEETITCQTYRTDE